MNVVAEAGSRRHAVLQALGITPWVLRERSASAQDVVPADDHAASAHATSCVVLVPEGCDPRAMDLLGRALTACGAELARAGRIRVAQGHPSSPVPHAPVYLVFGQAQAHALGRELPAAVMGRAHIAMADEPQQLLTAESKRRLWLALRQARRALAAARSL